MKRLLSITLFVLTAALYSFTGAGLNVGDNAQDFKLKNVDGKYVSLSDMKDVKGVIVIFTCNHCPFAKAYEDRIIALDKKYRKQGYPVVAISPNDPKESPEDAPDLMASRAKEKGYTFPYLFDDTQVTSAAYGVAHTPQVFLLQRDKNGQFKVAYTGAIDNDTEGKMKDRQNYVEDAIAALQKGKTPDPATTKAIGCSIKWRKA